MNDLTERTKLLIEKVPDQAVQGKLVALFEKDAALFGPPTTDVLERVRFAAIRLAFEGERQFEIASNLYIIDTRDLLMCAEFANDVHAHENWCHKVLEQADV